MDVVPLLHVLSEDRLLILPPTLVLQRLEVARPDRRQGPSEGSGRDVPGDTVSPQDFSWSQEPQSHDSQCGKQESFRDPGHDEEQSRHGIPVTQGQMGLV